MKLHSPGFEKRLGRLVRQTVRASQELRKEARRARRAKHYRLNFVGRLLVTALPVLAAWWIADESKNAGVMLGFISLWMFVWLCARVQGLLSCLHSDPELGAFSLLPIAPSDVFRWQLQKFLRKAVMSLVDLAALLAAFGAIFGIAPGQWLILMLIALLSWLTFIACVFFCAAHWPRLPYGLVWGMAFLIGVICLFGRELLVRYLLAFFNLGAPLFNMLPTGWSVNLSRPLVESGQWLRLLLLIPVVGVLATMKNSLARLRKDYDFTEVTADESPDLIPGHEPPTTLAESQAKASIHLGETAIEEIILTRQFYSAPNWQEQGPLERLLWRWFSARERSISEFVFPEGCSITALWGKVYRNLGIAVIAAFALGWIIPSVRLWILGLGFFVTFSQTLLCILASGHAFQLTQCSGVNIPLYAAYAIGFRELSRLLFKYTFVQTVVLVPFTAICGLLIAYLVPWPMVEGLMFGIKTGFLLLSARFITVMFAFSSGTNDSTQWRPSTLLLLGTIVVLGLLFMGFGGTGLFIPFAADGLVPVGLVAWGLCVLASLAAYFMFRVYGWFYHCNRFDLMKVPSA